jgi:hypothetical protein
MMESYLKTNLVFVTCDGEAVMMTGKSVVTKLMKEKFPSVIVWHCINHR